MQRQGPMITSTDNFACEHNTRQKLKEQNKKTKCMKKNRDYDGGDYEKSYLQKSSFKILS